MPIPSAISDLSTTPGSNSPSGADSPSVLDDHQRTAYAFIKTLSDTKAATADSVLLTGAQTVAGVKTFSSTIVGSINGSAATATNVTGTVAIANGGTGQTTAAAAFDAIKQTATTAYQGASQLATDGEAQAGTSTTRVVTPDNLGATVLGIGQAWNLLTGSRVVNTTYTNSTGRPIEVAFGLTTGTNDNSSVLINGVQMMRFGVVAGLIQGGSFVVPAGATYRVDTSIATVSLWSELR